MTTTENTPHIGKFGYKPGDFGYEFDCDLKDCTFRGNFDNSGNLAIIAPKGKKVGLNIIHLLEASPDLLESLQWIFGELEAGNLVRDISKDDAPQSLKMLKFAANLQKAQSAINKATGIHDSRA